MQKPLCRSPFEFLGRSHWKMKIALGVLALDNLFKIPALWALFDGVNESDQEVLRLT